MAAAVDVLTANKLSFAIKDLTKDFFTAANKPKYEDYIGLEILCKEFLRLKLPKASEILNPAAGPGLLSARLQTKGYGFIDALDDDLETIQRLKKAGLYRTYINREMTSVNSTGLNEDIYDAVVTVGGFSPGKVPPKAFKELLRVTKPDGHILWTLRSDYHNKQSDFGLLDENLAALEKDGKCKVMKRAEKFIDPRSGLEGLLYIVRRVDTADFDPKDANADEVVNTVKNEAVEAKEDCVEEFTEAEDDLVMLGHYTGHIKLAQAFFKLRLPRMTEILDVSSHTSNPGLVGLELAHNGYVAIDGLDHNLGALNSIRRQGNVYRNYILGKVAELGSIPVNDESYDVILMAGGFAPGKITPSAFNELIRVLRPGGYILWTMRDGFGSHGAHHQDFALFDVRVHDLVKERKWELLVGPVFFDNFALHLAGRFYMLRKCHREVFALGSPRHSPNSSPRLARRRGSLANNMN